MPLEPNVKNGASRTSTGSAKEGTSPTVAIVLVNWNSLEDTLTCINSLGSLDYSPFFIVLVDNGSTCSPIGAVRAVCPDVLFHETGRNLGYTGGNNIGARIALSHGADYVLCLNNDTVVATDLLQNLVLAMETRPTAGFATPAIYEAEHPERLAGLGCEIRLDKSPCAFAIRRPKEMARPHGVPFVEGCAMFVRRAAFEQTGGFDDSFFAYLEDADLCLRGKAHGWGSLAVPAARVWHKVERQIGGRGSPSSQFYFYRNSRRLVRRHGTPDEKRSFSRSHAIFLRKMLRRCESISSATTDGRNHSAEQECVAVVLGTVAGQLGFSNDRNKRGWRTIETFLAPSLRFFLAIRARVSGSKRAIKRIFKWRKR